MSPRNRVAWLYLQALGSIFVDSYDLQGYSEGIRTNLHMGLNAFLSAQPLISKMWDYSVIFYTLKDGCKINKLDGHDFTSMATPVCFGQWSSRKYA
jgi:hypothetical protein